MPVQPNVAYDLSEDWEPSSEAALLAAHDVLMAGLIDAPGRYRTGQVGVVRARQSAYYHAIERSSEAGESTQFVGFMLEAILDAVREGTPQETPQVSPQVERLLRALDEEMSGREILEALGLRDRKWLRRAYLGPALQGGLIEMTRPEAPSARNQRYRLTPVGRRVRG